MRLPRLLHRTALLCATLLAVSASVAAAAHVPGVLPLTSSSNHSNEKFSPTAFPAADYTGYVFAGADLTNCSFAAGSNLTFANFQGAKLTNVSFSGCILDGATFLGADLTFATLPCMGGANFRGAILTGAVGGGGACASCVNLGPNVTDNCTVNAPPISLCTAAGSFRGLVSGVVFIDTNTNGLLDLGEPGLPGAGVNVNIAPTAVSSATDSRGGYFFTIPNGGTGTVQVTLPVGYILSGPASVPLDLNVCRSSQGIHFPATTAATPAQRSTFARVKALYR